MLAVSAIIAGIQPGQWAKNVMDIQTPQDSRAAKWVNSFHSAWNGQVPVMKCQPAQACVRYTASDCSYDRGPPRDTSVLHGTEPGSEEFQSPS